MHILLSTARLSYDLNNILLFLVSSHLQRTKINLFISEKNTAIGFGIAEL